MAEIRDQLWMEARSGENEHWFYDEEVQLIFRKKADGNWQPIGSGASLNDLENSIDELHEAIGDAKWHGLADEEEALPL